MFFCIGWDSPPCSTALTPAVRYLSRLVAATIFGVVSTTASTWPSRSSNRPATGKPAARMPACACSVAAKTGMSCPVAVRIRQSVATSATPTSSMSGIARTASATRLPITP